MRLPSPTVHVGRCVAGASAPVKIDPADPSLVMVEWEKP
jgi:hypothetical protein